MSEVFLYSSFSQGSYLICDKQRRNSTRSSFRDVSWLTMIGFFGINHHDFLQLKESSLSEMNTVMVENHPPSPHSPPPFENDAFACEHTKPAAYFNMKVQACSLWMRIHLYLSLNKMFSLCDVIESHIKF